MLAIKAGTNDMHAIFLLKKNTRSDIIKTILGYLSIRHQSHSRSRRQQSHQLNMNLQKINKTTKQDQELSIEEKKYLQILKSLKTTMTKMESLDTLTAISTNI